MQHGWVTFPCGRAVLTVSHAGVDLTVIKGFACGKWVWIDLPYIGRRAGILSACTAFAARLDAMEEGKR